MIDTLPRKIDLPAAGDAPAAAHLFDEDSAWAILAALAAGRPLLVRGEPGVGKSQLAHAAAVWLNRPFLSTVVDIRTESQDMLYSFDAVRRLAEAQLCAARQVGDSDDRLAERRFLLPGKLWWAFDWGGATIQAELGGGTAPNAPEQWSPGDGCVLLIDEIDKAESDVPNGLLEALGSRSFPVRGRKAPVVNVGKAPLIVVTTNEDRALPNAFVRRCLVLPLQLPADDDPRLRTLLADRGHAHLPGLERAFLEEAADCVIAARVAARAQRIRPLPGQAEYLDLLRAAAHLSTLEQLTPSAILDRVKRFVLNKQAGGAP